MTQARQHARFTLEAGLEGDVDGQLGRQQLDRHHTIELGVTRAEYTAHTAAPDLFQKLQPLRVLGQRLGLVQARQ
jgi:hypothetical protein